MNTYEILEHLFKKSWETEYSITYLKDAIHKLAKINRRTVSVVLLLLLIIGLLEIKDSMLDQKIRSLIKRIEELERKEK